MNDKLKENVQPVTKKLGISAKAKISNPSMSGCGKWVESDCGISQKSG